jgi:hypothetical protein
MFRLLSLTIVFILVMLISAATGIQIIDGMATVAFIYAVDTAAKISFIQMALSYLEKGDKSGRADQ